MAPVGIRRRSCEAGGNRRRCSGARVGDPLSRWTELHPDAEVDLVGPVDYIGPIVMLVDGPTGSIDTDDDNRITSLWAGPFICDE